MDREKIIQMARESGISVFEKIETAVSQLECIERFASAIRAATKEEDARICEGYYERNLADSKIEKADGAYACCSAIRASK